MKTLKKTILIIIAALFIFILFNDLFINKPFDEDTRDDIPKPEYVPEPEPEFITDSSMTFRQATTKKHPPKIPSDILGNLALVDVKYYSFDGKIHRGQVVVHKTLKKDIQKVFQVILAEEFPVYSVIPVSLRDFSWNDDKTMAANNTSAFNYRMSTGSSSLSTHAKGLAIDINPLNNPYIKKSTTLPPGAVYDTTHPATLTSSSVIVKTFIRLGWTWGGNWKSLKDYQHFEKKTNE